MKKLIFTATLPIAFIIIPPLAFTDEKMDEKNTRYTPTEIVEVLSNWKENPQTTIENDGINSVPVHTIDDDGGYGVQIDMEFRECG